MSRHQVLIAGGGVAALEAALALRAHAGSHVDVTLVAPDTHFTYRPLSVGQPFGLGGAVRYELSALARNGGFAYRRGTVGAVDPDRRCVSVDGEDVVYDSLILALGARASSAVDGAVTFDGPRSVERVARALAHLSQAGGGTAAFVAPPGVDWTLPIYELALMTSTWAAARNLPVEVLVATGETGPLAAMGRVAEEALTEALDERGIDLHVSLTVRSFAWASLHHDAGSIPADIVVALPRLVGRAIPGLGHDRAGFVDVDEFGRVRAAKEVYAIGDCASHRIKQGGLATQQADLAAEVIAHTVGARPAMPEIEHPVLRVMVMTGDRPIWLTDRAAAGLRAPAESGFLGPWWPPHKIAGHFLGPFLLTHQHLQRPPAGDPGQVEAA